MTVAWDWGLDGQVHEEAARARTVWEKGRTAEGGAGEAGRASEEQGPRRESRVCPASGKDEREMSKSGDHEGPVFRDGLLQGQRKVQAVSEKGCGAQTKLPGAMAGDSMCRKSR